MKKVQTYCSCFFALQFGMSYLIASCFTMYLSKRGFEAPQIAVLLTVSSGLNLVLRPLISPLIDRGICKKLSVIAAILIMCGSASLFLIEATSFFTALVFTVFAIGGNAVFGILSDPWVLKLMERYPEVDYGKARSYGSASSALVAVICGYLLNIYGFSAAFIAVVLFLSVLLAVSLRMPEPDLSDTAQKPSFFHQFSFLKKPEVLIFILLSMLGNGTMDIVESYVPVLLIQKGGTTSMMGWITFIGAGIEFIGLKQFSRVLKRIRPGTALCLGMTGYALKAICVSQISVLNGFYLIPLFQLIAFCLFIPSRVYILQECVGSADSASALSVTFTCYALFGTFIGNPLSGVLSKSIGTERMLICFAGIALFGAAAYAIYLRTRNKNESRTTNQDETGG